MPTTKQAVLPLQSEADIVNARQTVRKWAAELAFSIVDQTKIVTAASELARNTIIYGKGGQMEMQAFQEGIKVGLRLSFVDQGPGIADIETALRDGYTTGKGLGLGLSGSRRLCNEFEVTSKVGEGTRVTIARWRNA